jgi:hypothetical protein
MRSEYDRDLEPRGSGYYDHEFKDGDDQRGGIADEVAEQDESSKLINTRR